MPALVKQKPAPPPPPKPEDSFEARLSQLPTQLGNLVREAVADTLSATGTVTSATIGGRLHRKLWAEPAANDDEEVLMITNAFFDQVVRR